MRLKTRSIRVLKPLWLALGLNLAITMPYAASFYTIIGPDGHPMVVQSPSDSKQTEAKAKKEVKKDSVVAQTSTETPPEKIKRIPDNQKIDQIPPAVIVNTEKASVQSNKQIHQSESVINSPTKVAVQPQLKNEQVKQSQQVKSVTPSQSAQSETNHAPVQQQNVQETSPIRPERNDQVVLKSAQAQKKPDDKQQDDSKNFTVIDGEKYVNNEYLEDKEFNLEGKKRFYMTPEVGSSHGRFETIERKKGISKDFLNQMLNKDSDIQQPIVLSKTYFRLPKDEVVKNLEQSCFSGKKITKAKGLSLKNQELGVWPVAPIKEHFAYEVVKIEPQVQNVLLTSYASSSKAPTYYWPLVVFLDQQGCVLEGVSGFKNEDSVDNNLQYAAMEGILRKPEHAVYMFLTPLSSAVDAENKQLTNHGQIKLSVIQ